MKIPLGWGGVDPDRPDNDGQTPLISAVWKGDEGVVKILLKRDDINPDKPDNDGQTPLYCAAWKVRKEVEKILLRLDDVHPTNWIATVKPHSVFLFGKGMRE